MPTYSPDLDSDALANWGEVLHNDLRWKALLLGNGASIAVWPLFNYPSLYEHARSNQIENPLTDRDVALFECFGTQNFELVLGSLKTAAHVANALGEPDVQVRERYEHIQRALFQAVGGLHVPWDRVAGERLRAIRTALRAYPAVYSTNYDLLAYWSVMHGGAAPGDFKDFFWSGPDQHEFDGANTQVSGNATLMYYLHGGIHLLTSTSGGTRKRVPVDASLLDDFEIAFDNAELPLLVSEGTATDKLAAIRRSDYLSFAYASFAAHEGGLVIFGQSLQETDRHLIDVLNGWQKPWREPLLAISVRRLAEGGRVRQRKLALATLLPHADIVFFDPETHPLGDPALAA